MCLNKSIVPGIRVARVPSYSPGSIAEYAITQIMALAKNTHMSYVMTKKVTFLTDQKDMGKRTNAAYITGRTYYVSMCQC